MFFEMPQALPGGSIEVFCIGGSTYCTEAEQQGTCEHWRFPWENSDANGGKYLQTGRKELSCAFFFPQRPWHVASWDKKTLSKVAEDDLFLSSNLAIYLSLLPFHSFLVH